MFKSEITDSQIFVLWIAKSYSIQNVSFTESQEKSHAVDRHDNLTSAQQSVPKAKPPEMIF